MLPFTNAEILHRYQARHLVAEVLLETHSGNICSMISFQLRVGHIPCKNSLVLADGAVNIKGFFIGLVFSSKIISGFILF